MAKDNKNKTKGDTTQQKNKKPKALNAENPDKSIATVDASIKSKIGTENKKIKSKDPKLQNSRKKATKDIYESVLQTVSTDEKDKPPPKPIITFSGDLYGAFKPFRVMLRILGRFPVKSMQDSKNKLFLYSKSRLSFNGIYFIISSILVACILLFGTIGFAIVALRFDHHENATLAVINCSLNDTWYWRHKINEKQLQLTLLRERALLKRHQIPLIVIWTSLILAIAGSLNMYVKWQYFVNFLNFWSRAVHTMHMDVSPRLMSYSLVTLVVFATTTVTYAILGIVRYGPLCTGAPTLMALFLFKLYDPLMLEPPSSKLEDLGKVRDVVFWYQFIAGFTILFIYIFSRSYILLFVFKCKILQNGFACWNARVYAAILRGGEYSQTAEGRTLYKLLFKDHCVLLDLLEGTDHFFSGLIETYYLLQIISICFEVFFVIRVAREGRNQLLALQDGYFVRGNDWLPSILILFQSLYLMWIVSRAAAAVGEEAIAGLEVIRRKIMIGRRTDEELYFALSMYSSYTGIKKVEVSGAGFFNMNKSFMVGLLSGILSYFVIIFQFNPPFDVLLPVKVTDPDYLQQLNLRKWIGLFLYQIEGLPTNHWTRANITKG